MQILTKEEFIQYYKDNKRLPQPLCDFGTEYNDRQLESKYEKYLKKIGKTEEKFKEQIEKQRAKMVEQRNKPLTEEEKQHRLEKLQQYRVKAIEHLKEKPPKPIKKKPRKQYKGIDTRSDFCIMPEDSRWKTKREEGLERHEVFNNRANRPKSIEDGLVIFLRPDQHRIGAGAIHNDKEFREYAQRIAMKAWCEYYKKTEEEFKGRYGFYAR